MTSQPKLWSSMLKLLSLFLLFSLALFGADKIEIYSSNMASEGEIVTATDGVTVVYKDYILTADRLHYDRASEELELFDDIRVNNGDEYKVLGKYAKMNLAKKEKFFQPFYMTDKKTDLWMSATQGQTKDNFLDVHSGTISGCNPFTPKWKMEFSSLDYDSDDKWMNIYNARFYFADIPVLYTPYFGYSTDTTRKTGLLMPSLGVSSSEGIFYAQPIYIAEQNWWDMEITPQVRTSRGKGIYQTFRFVDSSVSHGEFTTGYFEEEYAYAKKYNLKNKKHYGANFKYENSDFINNWFGTHLKGQSGIYADVNYMNDVDYINLASSDTINNSTATQVLSRVNLFYNGENNYVGSYFKNYQNLTYTPQQQKELLQKLPTLQYHYYLNTFLEDHLLYNLDVQTNNSTRQEGKTAVQTDVKLPVTLQTSLLDEYLNLSYTANLYLQQSSLGGTDKATAKTPLDLEDGYYASNTHTVSLSTELTKGYKDVSHVISFAVRYNKPGSELRNGYYENNESCQFSSNPEECAFYNITSQHEEAKFEFIQYVYGANASQILYHRLSQTVTFTDNNQSYSELENELDYKVTSYLSIYNDMFYNYDRNAISKALNRVTLNSHSVSATVSHLYEDSFKEKITSKDPQRYTSYITSNFGYVYNSHYSFDALFNYDTIKDEIKSRGVGFMYKSKCLDFGLKYQENRRPITTTDPNNPNSFVYDKFIFLSLVLKPIMQNSGESLFTYQLPNKD